MPIFTGRSQWEKVRSKRWLFHYDAFGEGDAGQRPEVRITAFYQLHETDGCQSRRDRVGPGRPELADVAGERAPLRVVLIAHIDNERRCCRIVDEVVADRLGLPRFALGWIAPQSRVEHALREQMTGRRMIGMPIGPIGNGHHFRLRGSYQARDGSRVTSVAADRTIGYAQVDPPRRAKHHPCGLGLGEPLVDRPVAAHLTSGEIAQPDANTERHVLGDDATDADLDVVRMRADREKIDLGQLIGHRVQPNTSSPLSGSSRAPRTRIRDARNAPVTESPPRPSANR